MQSRRDERPTVRLGVALLALAGAQSCASEVDPRASLALADQAPLLRSEVELPFVPEGANVRWVAQGLAGLDIELELASARAVQSDARRFFTWRLPVALAETGGRASAQPELIGLPIARIIPGAPVDPSLSSAFWVEDHFLTIVLEGDDGLPERFRVVYPIQAAQLAQTALMAGFPPEEVHRGPRLRGDVSVEALTMPTSSRLIVPLPALAAGTLSGGLSLQFPLSDKAPDVRARLTLAGEEIHTTELPRDGSVLPLGRIAISATRSGDALVLEVEGQPGNVVFFEAPVIGRPRAEESDGPNVLLVVIDTLRADRLSALGGNDGLTPNLDRLCDESLVFSQCWSGASWTLPSIATMLTANHGGQHGAWFDDRRLGPGLDTLPELFRRAGYRTAAFTDGAFVGPRFGFDRGFVTYDGTGGGVEPVVERARRFLDSADGPWFVLLHTYEVHAPYEPPKDAWDEVLARHPGVLGDESPAPHRFYELVEKGGTVPPEVFAVLEDLYDEEVRYTDRVLGELFEQLRAQGVLDDTVVCVTSDHGEEFGEHGLLGHGDTLYVEQLHVPLFVRFPDGRRAGEVDSRPVSLVDLAPTLVEAAGLALDLGGTTFDGRSLLGQGSPSPVYAARNNERYGLIEALREDDQVWIHGGCLRPLTRPSTAPWQHYDLSLDAEQRHPTSEDPSGPARELAARLRALSERYGHARVEDAEASPDAQTRLLLERLGYAGSK